MRAEDFLRGLDALGVDFYTGVPDSLLQPLNDALYTAYGLTGRHVVAADEGGAVGLAAGHYLATGHPALCYLQNSGIGNLFNPAASLLHPLVYGIPCVFAVGWRGEPGVKDEPQHAFQGRITRESLELLGLRVFELSADTDAEAFDTQLRAIRPLLAEGKSAAFLLRKAALTGPRAALPDNGRALTRESALRTLLLGAGESDVFVSTTGKTSREVYELREALGQGHGRDFLTVGSMGHAGMIALGIAKAKPETTVWCLDGDGAALMHMGSLAVEAQQRCTNLVHVLLNNGAHESVGGMPVAGGSLRYGPIARACGYDDVRAAENEAELAALLPELKADTGRLRFVEILLRPGSRADLGRPQQSPIENRDALMRTLGARPYTERR